MRFTGCKYLVREVTAEKYFLARVLMIIIIKYNQNIKNKLLDAQRPLNSFIFLLFEIYILYLVYLRMIE